MTLLRARCAFKIILFRTRHHVRPTKLVRISKDTQDCGWKIRKKILLSHLTYWAAIAAETVQLRVWSRIFQARHEIKKNPPYHRGSYIKLQLVDTTTGQYFDSELDNVRSWAFTRGSIQTVRIIKSALGWPLGRIPVVYSRESRLREENILFYRRTNAVNGSIVLRMRSTSSGWVVFFFAAGAKQKKNPAATEMSPKSDKWSRTMAFLTDFFSFRPWRWFPNRVISPTPRTLRTRSIRVQLCYIISTV